MNVQSFKSQTVPFFKLPLEIREIIYQYAVTSESDVFIQSKEQRNKRDFCSTLPPAAQLVRASRRTYIEANAFLYNRNVFHFSSPVAFESFVYDIGSFRRSPVRSISIFANDVAQHETWATSLQESGLKELSYIKIHGGRQSFSPRRAYELVKATIQPELLKIVRSLLGRETPRSSLPMLELRDCQLIEQNPQPDYWQVVQVDTPRARPLIEADNNFP
ncbi:MAG: hypothetical protein M1827_001963 [Pycnora praestabilis]|nr:MAG: hypothetical protein M1827_001963 [Pycnora praestabilis]